MVTVEVRVLSVVGVTKYYGAERGIDDLSFELPAGQVVGLLGANGAGKTTLLRVVTLSSAPDAGAVLLDGEAVAGDPICYRRQYGYVPAEPFLYDHLTAREFLEFLADMRSLPVVGRQALIDGHLARFDMLEDADRLIAGYSSGMRRKISIVAALLHAPRLLFLDEPTNALDAVSVRRLRNLLMELRAQGVAILLTTHILEVVEKVADRIVILQRGRKVAEGTLAELQADARMPGTELEDMFLAVTGERV